MTVPMLAVPFEKATSRRKPGRPLTFEEILEDDSWECSQKIDGERRMVVVENGKPRGINRTGGPTTLPTLVERDFQQLAGRWVFDGELVGSTLWLFDVIEGSVVQPGDTLADRRLVLDQLANLWVTLAVKFLPVAVDVDAKLALIDRLRKGHAEGFMAKLRDQPYQEGARAKHWVKVKFTRDVDCVIVGAGKDGKHNFVLGMFDGYGDLREVGEVSALTGDGPRIRFDPDADVDDWPVVAVKVLYATDDDRLYQPVTPRLRADKKPRECTIDQLEEVRTSKEILLP